MPDNDVGRLVVRYDADITRLEQKLDRAMQRNATAMRRIVTDTDTAMARARNSLGNVWSAGQNRLLQQGTSALGLLGEGLGALGPLGIAAGAGMGALAVGLQQARAAMAWADDLGDTAERMRITAEQLQVLDQTVEHFGGNAEQGRQAIDRLTQAIGAMHTGIGTRRVAPAFEALGITPEMLRNVQNGIDLLPMLADRISAVGSAADQAQIARRLGIEPLLPVLRQGSQGVREYEERLRSLGMVVANETVNSMNDMAERTREAEVRMQAASRTISANLAPAMTALAEAAAGAITQIASLIGWIRHFDSVDAQMQVAINQAVQSRARAAAARNGTWLEAVRAGVRGAGGQEAREATARDNETSANRASLRAITIMNEGVLASVRAAQASQQAAEASAAAATGTRPPRTRSGGSRGGGRSRAGGAAPVNTLLQPGAIEALSSDRSLDNLDHPFIGDWNIVRIDASGLRNVALEMQEGLEEGHERLVREWSSVIQDGLESAIHGGWKGLALWMAQTLERALLQSLSNGLAQFLAPNSAGGGGIGGLIRGAIGIFTGNPALIASEVVGTIPLPTHAHASGTMAAPGGLSWVGENGPELLNLPKGAQVFPAHVSRALALDGARSSVSNVTINLHADGAVLGNELVNTLMQLGEARIATAEASLRVSIPADLARRSMRRLS